MCARSGVDPDRGGACRSAASGLGSNGPPGPGGDSHSTHEPQDGLFRLTETKEVPYREKHLLLSGALALVAVAAAPVADAFGCTPVGTSRGPLTAAVTDTNVGPGADVDGTGCDIAVYYSQNSGSWSVQSSDVHGAQSFGVWNDGAGNVTIDDSRVHDIGDVPFNGVQRGLAVLYGSRNDQPATGTISDSTVDRYQKNGITVIGPNSSANITDTTVTGLGKIEFIAQNGIQISDGATPLDVSGNTVTGNHYSGPSKPTIATGILLLSANIAGRDVGRISSSNEVNHNQANIAYVK